MMQLHDLQEPAFKFDEFGTLLREQIKILFVGQDGWEYETELPAVPGRGDVITFWLETPMCGFVNHIEWMVWPDRCDITVYVDVAKRIDNQ